MKSSSAAPAVNETIASLAPAGESSARTPSLLEYISVVLFLVLCAVLAIRLVGEASGVSFVPLLIAAALGYVASDFASGLVHWGFDTWGAEDTPVLGPTFIVPFRVHHSDPLDITRHGFVATNGHNCLVSLPVLGLVLALPPGGTWTAPLAAFVLFLTLGVFATNQFHKWAHEANPGPVVGWLQDRGIILGREHHDVHHSLPYDKHYCITTGWLNRPLDRIGFFRITERVITAVTGAQPRRDDLREENGSPEGDARG